MKKDKANSLVKIDAMGIHYRDLNARLWEVVAQGARRIELRKALAGDVHC